MLLFCKLFLSQNHHIILPHLYLMFCDISVQQHHQDALFAVSLLWLIASMCFKHLFAHHQEAPYKQLVYTVPPGDEQISTRNMYRLLIVINQKQTAHLVSAVILICTSTYCYLWHNNFVHYLSNHHSSCFTSISGTHFDVPYFCKH
jgi:hypothetical protein